MTLKMVVLDDLPVHAMRRGNDPSLVDQRAAARYLLIEVLALDNRGLPGHLAIFSVLAADNLRGSHVGSAAFWGNKNELAKLLPRRSQLEHSIKVIN